MKCPCYMIRWDTLDGWLDRGEQLLLVDLRAGEEYGKGHLKGAVNIPYEELEYRYAELPKDRLLVFYCSRGAQSMRACGRLCSMGYRTADLAGGLLYYRGKYMENFGKREGREDLRRPRSY